MLITILVTLIVSLSLAQRGIREYLLAPSLWTLAAGGVYALVAILLTVSATRAVTVPMRSGLALSRGAMRKRNILEAVYRFWLIAGQGSLVMLGYGQWIANVAGRYRVPLLEKIILLGPFAAILIIGWALDYRFHLAIRTGRADGQDAPSPYWSRSQHIFYNIRHMLLFVLVPIGLILLVVDITEMYLLHLAAPEFRDAIYLTASLGTALIVFLVSPLILTRIWSTRKLEPGQLRTDLEEMCAKLGLKYRDILVWESNGVIANAAVMGLVAPVRFILVSDGIVNRLERQHIRAVFAHEGGHIVSHHLPYLMLAAISILTLCEAGANTIAVLAGLSAPVVVMVMLGLTIVAGGLVFGLVSRQFERQSDVTGAWASGDQPDGSPRISQEGAAIFAGALEQIARLNGMDPGKRNWSHGSISSRVRYILSLGSTAGTRTHIDKTVKRIKIAIILLAISAAPAVALQVQMGW